MVLFDVDPFSPADRREIFGRIVLQVRAEPDRYLLLKAKGGLRDTAIVQIWRDRLVVDPPRSMSADELSRRLDEAGIAHRLSKLPKALGGPRATVICLGRKPQELYDQALACHEAIGSMSGGRRWSWHWRRASSDDGGGGLDGGFDGGDGGGD